MTEGKKTAMLELLEQLEWQAPTAVFVSVGDGSIIGGLHKGAKDALALGLIDSMPRIYGVQAAGSDYMVQAFESGDDVLSKPAISAETVADSISADLPRDRIKAMAAVVETGGAYLKVRACLPSRPGLRRTPGCSPLPMRIWSTPTTGLQCSSPGAG
jgi:threonine synthase